MAYCTVSDIQKHLKDWAKLTPTTITELDFAAEMIRQADSYIDSRLHRRYGSHIPFNPVPQSIKSISVLLTIYYVLACNFAGQAVEKIESIKRFYYDPAVKWLDFLSKGNLEIPEIDSLSDNLLVASSTEDFDLDCDVDRTDETGAVAEEGSPDWNY